MRTCTLLTGTGMLAACASLTAADILVPQDAPDIQAAIAAANDGDRILVSAGTWTGPVDFLGRSVVLESVDGAEATIIDGLGEVGYVVRVASGEGEGTVLRGFTITGGFGSAGTEGEGPGGGVLVSGAALLIDACILTENAGIKGGGVRAENGAAIEVRLTEFTNNTALFGGGLSAESSLVRITDSLFTDNAVINSGGGLSLLGVDSAEVVNSTFRGNIAHSFGGAIFSGHSTLALNGLLVEENGRAVEGEYGGLNVLPIGGGGIYTTASEGRIEASRLLGNNGAFGSGLYIAGEGELKVINTLIASNGAECACGTGAVYANASSPRIINTTIADNGGFFGVFTTWGAEPLIENTIIAGMINNLGAQSPTGGNGLPSVRFSLLQADVISDGENDGNIFINAFPQLDRDNDFAPLPGSAAIDAGDNGALPADVFTDLLGNARIANDIVDIGAVEFGADAPGGAEQAILGDMDGDGVVGLNDLLMLLAAWGPCAGCEADMNGDGVVDLEDLLLMMSHWGSGN